MDVPGVRNSRPNRGVAPLAAISGAGAAVAASVSSTVQATKRVDPSSIRGSSSSCGSRLAGSPVRIPAQGLQPGDPACAAGAATAKARTQNALLEAWQGRCDPIDFDDDDHMVVGRELSRFGQARCVGQRFELISVQLALSSCRESAREDDRSQSSPDTEGAAGSDTFRPSQNTPPTMTTVPRIREIHGLMP